MPSPLFPASLLPNPRIVPKGDHPALKATARLLENRHAATKRTQSESAPAFRLRLLDEDERPGIFLQATEEGGELIAGNPALLYAAAAALCDGTLAPSERELKEGLHISPSFPFHRPLFDTVLTQVGRNARDFDPEPYIETLAASGFTHLEVNGLATSFPHEEGRPYEFYRSFYDYCPGLNHFVDSELTRGVYPADYLETNLERVRKTAEIGRRYGLTPGFLCFEPRSLPESFFQRYPTLRGARIDHPFRSHLPRYTLAQDHPVSRAHYAELMRKIMEAVPDLGYLSVWTNDSGAGFEHTSSLYVGRNGGPYLIREWREHEQIAETAGKSALRWLRLMQETAAEVNPSFQVFLRIEPFKVEHDTLIEGMGSGLSIETPTLLVRGYDLPYEHPRYEEQTSVGGSIMHTGLDDRERELLGSHRERGFEPALTYAAGSSFNLEPLLGIPFPRMLHKKLTAMKEAGFEAASAIGGLLHLEKTPFWPHPQVIRAAQLTPELPVDTLLERIANRFVGAQDADKLVKAWDAVEEAVSYLPVVPLYSIFGLVWLRTWVRPLVPDIEAIPEEERAYYERHFVSTPNNPNINDLGKDVLFELLNQETGATMANQIGENVLPRLDEALSLIRSILDDVGEEQANTVFADLLARTRTLRCWATTQQSTCAWVAGVYGYRNAQTENKRTTHRNALDEMMDREIESSRELLDVWENSPAETFLVLGSSETSFAYGENIGNLLRRKIQLMERYRDHEPHIDEEIIWRLPGYTESPMRDRSKPHNDSRG